MITTAPSEPLGTPACRPRRSAEPLCDEPVQVMPPASATYVIPFALKVLGNMIVGILLLGGLFAAPAWLFSMITNF